MNQIRLRREPRLDAKCEAFNYQREAFLAVRDSEYACVFHEQGLGKTKIAIDLILYWLKERHVDTVLLIAKKALLANWMKELQLHSHLKPSVVSQNRRTNYFVFNTPSRLIIAHYEAVKGEIDRFKLFLRTRDVGVILDESTKIKNPNSSLTKAFFSLSGLFKRRVILTGTPIANRPHDIWAQVMFLDHGKSLGNDFSKFKRDIDLANDLIVNREKRERFEESLNSIYSRIGGFTVRETKKSGVVLLPEKVIKTITCEWEKRQYELYRDIQREMRAVVLKEGIPIEDNADETLKRLLRLVQVASNPRLIDEGYVGPPGKLEYLIDEIATIMGRGEKCIIWSSFTGTVDWLAEELKEYGTSKVHGRLSIERRNISLDDFSSRKDKRILVATPGAAKEGLTLTMANHVLFYDRSFSLDDYLQAQDRIHRISQQRKCYVTNLIMPDSIDEWVEILLDTKELSAQLGQGDISLEEFQCKVSYDFGTVIKSVLGLKDCAP